MCQRWRKVSTSTERCELTLKPGALAGRSCSLIRTMQLGGSCSRSSRAGGTLCPSSLAGATKYFIWGTDKSGFTLCIPGLSQKCVDQDPDSTGVYERSGDLFLHRIVDGVCGWIPCETKSCKLFLSDFSLKIVEISHRRLFLPCFSFAFMKTIFLASVIYTWVKTLKY